MNKTNDRQSGVELLKLIALFGIIICHIYDTLEYTPKYLSDYYETFENAKYTTFEYFVLPIFLNLGYFGDVMFMICTCWFLVGNHNYKREKIIKIVLNTFTISILFLLVYLLTNHNISNELIISSILPITRESNWYITCYILLYAIYPLLNYIVENIEQKHLLSFCIVSFVLYFIINFFSKSNYYHMNRLLLFIVMYLIVSYIKIYMPDYCNNLKLNIIIFICSCSLQLSIFIVRFFFYPIDINAHLLSNPFLLLMCISLLNIFRSFKFKSSFVNNLSSLSLYIYLIHENILFRSYTRVKFMLSLLENTGYSLILLKIVFSALILFIFVAMLSLIFKKVFDNPLNKIAIFINNKYENVLSIVIGK